MGSYAAISKAIMAIMAIMAIETPLAMPIILAIPTPGY
jgi:hypothetical protein